MIGKILNALGYEKRTYPIEYDPRFSPDVWGKAVSPGGYVSAAGVLSNSSVAFACVRLKAELLASVPFHCYHKLTDGSRERARNIPLARLLERPNAYMSAYEFVELISRSLDLTGNFFARVQFAPTGEPIALHPIASHRVQVERTQSGSLRYKVSAATNEPARTLVEGEMLHVKNASVDGLVGQSPLAVARQSLGLGMTLNNAALNLAQRGLKAPGVMIQPVDRNKRGTDAARDRFREQASDPDAPVMLDPGVRWISTAFSAADSELLESRKLSAEDTARVMGVPGASVGLSTSVSYGSAVQAQADLVVNTLAPLASRIEAAFEKCLLSSETQRRIGFEFVLDSLMRGDPSERWRSYEIGRRINVLSPNEIRQWERLPPYVGGDAYDEPTSQAPEPTEPPIASTKP